MNTSKNKDFVGLQDELCYLVGKGGGGIRLWCGVLQVKELWGEG